MRLVPRLTLLALLSPAALADTLVVGPAGSGAPYDSVVAAVQAASPGDTVLVLAGFYVEPAAVVIDKPLRLLGAGSSRTAIGPGVGVALGTPPLTIAGLAAGEEVRVAGLSVTSELVFALGSLTLVRVEGCAGPVVLADVDATVSAGSSGPLDAPVVVEGSGQVLFDGCTFTAGVTAQLGQPALRVAASSVHVNACAVTGGEGGATSGSGGTGGPGIRAQDAVVRLSASSVVGGPSFGQTLFGFPAVADGGAGLSAERSQVFLRGGPGNLLRGSAGSSLGSGAPAAVLDASSLLTTASDAQLAAGPDGDGGLTAPVVDAQGGTWTPLAERLAVLTAAPVVTRPGASVVLAPAGDPGGAFLTAFSLGQGPALAIPGVSGLALLDVQGFLVLGSAVLDAAGAAAFAVPIPLAAELAGVSVLVQGLLASPAGTLSFSAPALVAIAP